MLKVRQYLQPFVKDVETVGIMVKAYANLTGLAQACVKNGKLKVGSLLGHFVIGFNRRYPLFDFVDIGPGKEEADSKVRGMGFHLTLSCIGFAHKSIHRRTRDVCSKPSVSTYYSWLLS